MHSDAGWSSGQDDIAGFQRDGPGRREDEVGKFFIYLKKNGF